MPQLDIYMFTSLIYPVFLLFFCFFLFSYTVLFALAVQQFVIRLLTNLFSFTKPNIVIYYHAALLRALYFREAIVYFSVTQLLD